MFLEICLKASTVYLNSKLAEFLSEATGPGVGGGLSCIYDVKLYDIQAQALTG